MNAVISSLVLLSLVGLGYSWQYPLDADQTLWAFKTCQRQNDASNQLHMWSEWKLPNNPATHCYVKCVWIHLGLYNDKDKSIKVEEVGKQFTSRGLEVPGDLNTIAGVTNGSCAAIYMKTIKFFANNVDNLRTAFYGTRKVSNEWYAQNPDVKPKGIKISAFCSAENREQGKEGNCRHACSAYYYRLVDKDYEPINFVNLGIKGISNNKITNCRKKASKAKGCRGSDELYDCLMKHNKAGFEKVLQILDARSERY
uniref:27 kDa salivary protein n=1 Tax=Phlebotomus duboscqi TaxID=37738 RepID=Q06K66_PHLDU|nr:27 kDa salivary protein [Phlebotomus duboscqi]